MNKRLIVLFVSLVLIVLLVVLNSTVFVVSEISVSDDSDGYWYHQDEIITSSKINIGRNIFAVSENKAIENIHSTLPNIRVLGIERIFPNRVIIHITKRVPMVSIQITNDNQYIIADWDLRIIQISGADNEAYINSTKIKGSTYELEGDRDALIGTVLVDHNFKYIRDIAQSALLMGINDIGFSSFFDEISFSNSNYAYIKTNSGVTMVLVVGTDTSIEDQFQAAYSIYVSYDLNDPKRNSGYIIITSNGWKWSENSES